MNLGLDNLRELLERFLSDTGGRRGRDREQVRQGQEQGQGQGQAQNGGAVAGQEQGQTEGAAAADGANPGATGAATDAGAAQQSTFEREERPDPDELDEDEVVDDLYHRIETLEDELENNGAQLGTIQDSQEHVAEKVDDVDDTIRQLLGVYDQVTNNVNPFTGDGEEESGFGVFGDDSESESGDGFGLDEGGADDETVSFADLKDVIEDAAEASADERQESTAQKITFDDEDIESEGGDEDEDDTRVEVQATDRVSDDVDAGDAENENETGSPEDDVTLHTLANTYATDIIVFEWLTELVRTGGPAATLRAISYYHEIGWIGRDVKEHLESVLSGPDLDIHVDPGTTPDELTAEDHADSYTYIMKLHEIHETRQEVEP